MQRTIISLSPSFRQIKVQKANCERTNLFQFRLANIPWHVETKRSKASLFESFFNRKYNTVSWRHANKLTAYTCFVLRPRTNLSLKYKATVRRVFKIHKEYSWNPVHITRNMCKCKNLVCMFACSCSCVRDMHKYCPGKFGIKMNGLWIDLVCKASRTRLEYQHKRNVVAHIDAKLEKFSGKINKLWRMYMIVTQSSSTFSAKAINVRIWTVNTAVVFPHINFIHCIKNGDSIMKASAFSFAH